MKIDCLDFPRGRVLILALAFRETQPMITPGFLALLVSLMGGLTTHPAADPVRVLILSGQNNHDWRSTTPKLKAILEDGGRFAVDITETPGWLSAQSLEPYDVVLSNWNAFGLDPKTSGWPPETRQAYLEFVRRGKGHVVVHAGSASFPEWKEYGRLALATWKANQTKHGPRHEFPVRINNPSHPVTAGLRPFTIFDELWNRPEIAEGAEVLASSYSAPEQEGTGQWEPAVIAGRFGDGRSLAIMLGHDAEAMGNPGFQALLKRAVEWAATGRVTETAGTVPAKWRWERAENVSLALVGPNDLVWRFNFEPTLDTPYFHPLNSPEGKTLTWDKPPDHPWHHGLWFSWKFINKVNYWEIDSKTGRPAGQNSWKVVKLEATADGSARIELVLTYKPAGEDLPVMTEERTIEVSAPDREGVYAIDWTGVFRAATTVLLDRTPLPGEPDGQVWGGYAGLSLRFAGNLDARQIMTNEGPIIEMADDRYRGQHTAVDYSALVDGQAAGIAILNHPANPRTPTPWYVIRSSEMNFFGPAILCYEPMTLRPGDRLALRYRVLVHGGRWDARSLQTEQEKFSHQTPKSK